VSKASQKEQSTKNNYNREYARGKKLGRVIWRNMQTLDLEKLKAQLGTHPISRAMHAGALAFLTAWSKGDTRGN
jgi:hypothetical protein